MCIISIFMMWSTRLLPTFVEIPHNQFLIHNLLFFFAETLLNKSFICIMPQCISNEIIICINPLAVFIRTDSLT